MHSVLRPNYRLALALALEIEALRETYEFACGTPGATQSELDDLREELQHLEREFSLTGVTSEYDL